MRVYQLDEPDRLEPRSHPWVGSVNDPEHHYVDFVSSPERVRESIEDLQPWAPYRATQTLYGLIEWLNGPDSQLMTNDCAFNGPGPHDGAHSTRRLEASGRLMVLFRDLISNTDPAAVEAVTQQVAQAISPMEPDFEDGILGVSLVDVRFTTLTPPRGGRQLLISFWGWGDDAFEAMHHLDRTLLCLVSALRDAGRRPESPRD